MQEPSIRENSEPLQIYINQCSTGSHKLPATLFVVFGLITSVSFFLPETIELGGVFFLDLSLGIEATRILAT